MRKWLTVGTLIFLVGAGVVWAQPANDLFSQAVAAGTAYRGAYSEYITAKNQHLQYNTAATRLTAIAKTNGVLVKRNEWVVAYLRFLRQTLADMANIANHPQTVVYLDTESQINQLASLSDLGLGDSFTAVNAASSQWEKRLESIDRLAAAARLQIASVQLADFQSNLAGHLDRYQRDHASPSASQESTLNLVTIRLARSVKSREEVDDQLANYKTGYWAESSLWQNLVSSHQALREAAKLLLELSSRR